MKKQRDDMSEALTAADHDLYDARRSLERLTGMLNQLEIAREESLDRIKALEKTVQERGVMPSEDVPPVEKVRASISQLEKKMQALEPVNMLSINGVRQRPGPADGAHGQAGHAAKGAGEHPGEDRALQDHEEGDVPHHF